MSIYMGLLADEGLDTISNLRPTPSDEINFINAMEKNGRAFVVLAITGDKVVGFLDLQASEKSSQRHLAGFGLSVLAPYRRRGVARRLLNLAIEEAKAWPGFCRIELEVVPWNTAAIRLYESAGFFTEGVRQKALMLNDKPVDLVQMALVW